MKSGKLMVLFIAMAFLGGCVHQQSTTSTRVKEEVMAMPNWNTWPIGRMLIDLPAGASLVKREDIIWSGPSLGAKI